MGTALQYRTPSPQCVAKVTERRNLTDAAALDKKPRRYDVELSEIANTSEQGWQIYATCRFWTFYVLAKNGMARNILCHLWLKIVKQLAASFFSKHMSSKFSCFCDN